LDHMRDRGLIALENGTWQIKVPIESIYLEAPENLRQMVELQIERLSAEEQRVLEVASLAGVSFIAKANALGIVDKEKFENVCVELSRRQHLVRRTASHHFPDRTSPQCYEFAHALYREVFYHRQVPERRARLRLGIGDTAAEAFPLPA